jgi:hypothetical protein
MLLSLFLPIFLCLNCYALELHAPSSRLLFASVPYHSHIEDLISVARALPLKHHVTFAVVDEYAQMVRDKLEPYRLLTIVSLGSFLKVKGTYEFRYGESNIQFLSRIVIPDLLDDYIKMHDLLLAHLQNHSYDMMVLDFLAFAAQDLAHDLNIPMVIHSCMFVMDGPGFPAWIPNGWEFLLHQQLRDSFFLRFYNQVVTQLLMRYYFGSHIPAFNSLRRASNRTISKHAYGLLTQHWDNHPVLMSTTIALEFKYAYKPNHFFLGFTLEDQKKKPVSKTFEKLNKS